MSEYIVDTNVWVNASEPECHSPECIEACKVFLESIREMATAKVVLDEASLDTGSPDYEKSVLWELKRNLKEGDYAYDLFWRHIYENWKITCIELKYDSNCAELPLGMQIQEVFSNGFVKEFDSSDRKWIALYLKHPVNPIINASDSDWENARADLTKYGIRVRQLWTEKHIP